MSDYLAPVEDMYFVLNEIADLEALSGLSNFEDATGDTVGAILTEGAKLASEVLAPLNTVGDRQRSTLEDGVVRTPEGFKEAYSKLVTGGWNGLSFPQEYGGQGLPWLISLAIAEMWGSANLAFSLCPVLTQGAVEMLLVHGTETLKQCYLEKLVSGEWTATMNLTESQAGSDVGALTTRAVPDGNHYLITGTKIFITYGDHDLSENIIHMVLARIPGAPPGSKGISCFLVPKMLIDSNRANKGANDVRCVSLEHKLGIHASPTAVLSFGENDGAVGYLIGEENQGLACMFTMMNSERLLIGLQGLSLAERAFQHALGYAHERRQGRSLGKQSEDSVAIIEHPDVRRMLMTMRASIDAMRGLAYETGAAIDLARCHPDAKVRLERSTFVELMTPVVKAWCTDLGVEMTSIGIQVHGGMGYIEETGAAQFFRDARIAPIYEGTNGIQAFDLVMRKLSREGGAAVRRIIDDINALEGELEGANVEDLHILGRALSDANASFKDSTDWLLEKVAVDSSEAAAGAVSYLRMFGVTVGGSIVARGALAAQRHLMAGDGNESFLHSKITTARFYAEHILPHAVALRGSVCAGTAALEALDDYGGII